MSRIWTIAKVREMHKLYKTGLPLSQVAKAYEIKEPWAHRLFDRYDLPRRSISESHLLRNLYSDDELKFIEQSRWSGMSYPKIAREFSVLFRKISHVAIYQKCRKMGFMKETELNEAWE